jgi:TMEM175 potassium channel family protein
MQTTYNQIVGQSVERIAALSDGIFAVAMTLLVLDLKVPLAESIHSEHDLRGALFALAPRLLMFAMSVLTLGIFWVGQQTQFNNLERSDRSLSWIHIAFLGVVSLIPFSTALLAEFTRYRTALVIYWLNILLLGVILYLSWTCAGEKQLLKPDLAREVHSAVQNRILIAQALLRLRRPALLFQHLLEHCLHRRRSVELCCCSAPAGPEVTNETLPSRSR